MDTTDDRSEEELLTALRKGAFLLKHGRHGRPKVHFFRLAPGDAELRWRGASGAVKAVSLASVREFLAGQATEVFRRHPVREPAASFSLRYAEASGSSRTLDLTCKDRSQYSLWFRGLQLAVARATAAAAAGATGPGEEVIPGDVFVWGGAGGGALSSGAESGDEADCWPRGLTPAVVPGSGALDAAAAAIGRRHAAFISSEGALYVLGEGKGGKLGRGHDAPASSPHWLRRGLPPSPDGGQPAVLAAACGDEYTTAIASDGQLLAWGRLPGDPLPSMIPAPLRGALAGVAVCQVACGPFHAAAVAVDGRLFTWGEGFGGKLGHGDQAPRSSPTQVMALQSMPVLQVACGVWHTAAIVLEPPGLGLHMAVSLAGSGAGAPPGSPTASTAPSLSGGANSRAPAAATASPHAGDGTASSLDAAWTPSPHLIAPSAAGAAAAVTPIRGHHRRASSSFSAGGDGPGAYQEGRGGTLYTWGGVNEATAFETGNGTSNGGGGGGGGMKADSNRGCLGHGEGDLYSGQLTPARVGGALSGRAVRAVAAGSNFTLALTTAGAVFQMGATGAAPGKTLAPWEGAISPELVRGALQGYFVDAIACGAHHAVAMARPLERRSGRPADGAPAAVFAWGRGSEGQLGNGRWDDAAAPLAVEGALKGRRVLAVAAGGATTMVVTAHDPRKFEDVEGGKEAAEAASKALLALLEPRGGGGGGTTTTARPPRGFSFSSVSRSSASRQQSIPPNLGRFSASSVQSSLSGGGGGGGGGAGGKPFLSSSDLSVSQGIISIGGGGTSTPGLEASRHSSAALLTSQRSSMHSLAGRGAAGGPSSRPFSTGALSASDLGSSSSLGLYDDIMLGGTASSALQHQSRRSFSFNSGAGFGGTGGHLTPQSAASPVSKSGLDANGRSLRASPGLGLASAAAGGAESGGGGGGGDDARSSSSVASLQQELADRGRYITRLERRLSAMQRGTTADEGDAALRAAVAASAGQFRDSMRRASEGVATLSLSPRLTEAEEHGEEAAAAAGVGAGLLTEPETFRGFGAPEGDGSTEDLVNLVRRSSSYRRDSESSAAPTSSASAVAALEADLRRKQEELEAQQRRLEAWAAELRAKEEALEASRRAEGEESADADAAAMPPPPPPPPPPAAAAPPAAETPSRASPAVQNTTTTPVQAFTPAKAPTSAFAAALGAAVAGRHLPGEWTQQLEEGLTATFVRDPQTGTPRLKRLRFSTKLFSAASAAEWYDQNAHRFTADGGISGTSPPSIAMSLASSLAATPSRQSVASARTPGPGSAMQQMHTATPVGSGIAGGFDSPSPSPGVLPRPSPTSAFSAASASAAVSTDRLLQQQGTLPVPTLAHSRFDSRHMSFDARELAALHAELSPSDAPAASSEGGSRARRVLLDSSCGGGGEEASPAPEGSVSFGPVVPASIESMRADSSGPLGSPLTVVAEGEGNSGDGGSGDADEECSVDAAERGTCSSSKGDDDAVSSDGSLVSASSGAAPSTGAVASPPPPKQPSSSSAGPRRSSLHSFAISDARSTASTADQASPPHSPPRPSALSSSGAAAGDGAAPSGASGSILQGMVAKLARSIIGSENMLDENGGDGGDVSSAAPAAAEGAAPPPQSINTSATAPAPQKPKPAASPTLLFGGRRPKSADSASKKKKPSQTRVNGSGSVSGTSRR